MVGSNAAAKQHDHSHASWACLGCAAAKQQDSSTRLYPSFRNMHNNIASYRCRTAARSKKQLAQWCELWFFALGLWRPRINAGLCRPAKRHIFFVDMHFVCHTWKK